MFFPVESEREEIGFPRSSSLVPRLFPINTSRRAVVHYILNLGFRGTGRVMNDRLVIVTMIVAMAFFLTFHAENFGADLGTDFATDAAVRVDCGDA